MECHLTDALGIIRRHFISHRGGANKARIDIIVWASYRRLTGGKRLARNVGLPTLRKGQNEMPRQNVFFILIMFWCNRDDFMLNFGMKQRDTDRRGASNVVGEDDIQCWCNGMKDAMKEADGCSLHSQDSLIVYFFYHIKWDIISPVNISNMTWTHTVNEYDLLRNSTWIYVHKMS